jgi:hypothetical protein
MRLADWAKAGGHGWIERHARSGQAVLMLVDMKGGKARSLCKLPTRSFVIADIALSPDNKYLFYNLRNPSVPAPMETVQVEVPTGNYVREWVGISEWPMKLEVSTDGSGCIFSVTRDHVCAWDVATGESIARLAGLSVRAVTGDAALGLVTDGSPYWVVPQRGDPMVRFRLWDPRADRVLRSLTIPCDGWDESGGKIYAIRQTPKGPALDVHDVFTGQVLQSTVLDFSEFDASWVKVRGRWMLLEGRDNAGEYGVHVVDLDTWRSRMWLSVPPELPRCLWINTGPDLWMVSPDGRRLIHNRHDSLDIHDLPAEGR